MTTVYWIKLDDGPAALVTVEVEEREECQLCAVGDEVFPTGRWHLGSYERGSVHDTPAAAWVDYIARLLDDLSGLKVKTIEAERALKWAQAQHLKAPEHERNRSGA